MSQATLDPTVALEQWKLAWKPSSSETSYQITDIVGEVLKELRGTLYRNGPSQQVMPEGGYEMLHLFDGDALIHAYVIEDGAINFKSAFARTECFELEQQAGRLVHNTFNVQIDDPTSRASCPVNSPSRWIPRYADPFRRVARFQPMPRVYRGGKSRSYWVAAG